MIVGSKKNFVVKKFLGQKNRGQKILGSKNFGAQKNFGVKKNFGQKDLGLKFLCPIKMRVGLTPGGGCMTPPTPPRK